MRCPKQATTGGKSATYTYDARGNITAISDGTNTTSYVYDSLDQLTRENNQAAGKTWVYTYDNGGNILSKSEYAYTTGALGTALDTISYGYGDSEWRDLLTAYDGKRLTADEIGNLRNDGKWSYTWRRGRILWDMSRMVDEDAELFEVVQYRYDSNGRRTGKSYGDSYNFRIVGGQLYYVGDSTGTSYYYAGDDLSQIDITFPDNSSTSLHFTYDELGPMSVTYNGAEYFYLKNAQGDVTGLVNNSGTQVVAYTYDAWGNPLSTTGTMADTLGKLNPFRYRGYVYDTETGLYYLGSRYYNPETGRFINADGYVSTGQGVLEKNMYAYCLNNPVNMFDPSGEIAITTLILIGSIVAGVAVASYTAYTSHKYTGKVDWNNTILSGLSTFAFCYTCGMSAYGMYVSYCDYKGYAPVTNIGTSPKTNPAPYSNLTDPSNVAPGKDFTASQKAQIIQQNKLNNNGVVKSDLSGQILVPPQKSMKGVTPPTNEWQIDHIIPKSAGGTNSFSNAQVLSREENRIKWDH